MAVGGVLHLDIASRVCKKSLTDQRLSLHAADMAVTDAAAGRSVMYIVVSNDQDFLPLYSNLQRKGMQTANACYDEFQHAEVVAAVNKSIVVPASGAASLSALLAEIPLSGAGSSSTAVQGCDSAAASKSAQASCDIAPVGGCNWDRKLRRLCKYMPADMRAAVLGVRMGSYASACQQIALHVQCCCVRTYSALYAQFKEELVWLHDERLSNPRYTKPGGFKAYLVAGLSGLRDWTRSELQCVVEMLMPSSAFELLPNMNKGWLATALPAQLGMRIKVRCTSMQVSMNGKMLNTKS